MKTALKHFALAILAAIPLTGAGAKDAPPINQTAGNDAAPSKAVIGQMDWLVGQWSGTGIGGAPAHESWLPPVGGTMVGTFVQEDGESGIRFTEHIYLMEEEGTLVMRLKHFNADLTSWEEKNDTTDFKLISVEPCAAYFSALTIRCTGEGGGANDQGLIITVRMQSGDALTFDLKRAD